MLFQRAGVVQEIGDGILIVVERPERVAGGRWQLIRAAQIELLVGQDLINSRAPEIAVREISAAVEAEDQVAPSKTLRRWFV